jgi:1,4-alpha-glucan branching enzyme
MSWLDRYHADGVRVDVVESMLYLDYGRNEGEWIPNEFGGRENLGAVRFLKRLNEAVYGEFPDIITIAEESTSWPGVTRPVFNDGLGFGYKWDMGWMHDSLRYFKEDPLFRKGRHNDLTFRMLYAWTENFVLALSHDEVVHGKRSLLNRMPGDRWQQFANLRLLFAYMYGVPGKKLIFMGGEFGQWNEWWYERSLDWHLIHDPLHAGVMKAITDLNRLYQSEPALHRNETLAENFEWIDCDDAANSTLALLRKSETPEGSILVVFNFTPVLRSEFRVGAPWTGVWQEVFNSDSSLYGGSNAGNEGKRWTGPSPMHGREQSLKLTLPPLGAVFLRYRGLY